MILRFWTRWIINYKYYTKYDIEFKKYTQVTGLPSLFEDALDEEIVHFSFIVTFIGPISTKLGDWCGSIAFSNNIAETQLLDYLKMQKEMYHENRKSNNADKIPTLDSCTVTENVNVCTQ